MMAKTHLLLALTVTSFALETTHPLTLGLAALASQLPDVDMSSSLAGRLMLPLARWLERRFPHRTVTHSVLATVVIALLSLPLRWQQAQLWYAVMLGYGSGWFGDAFTKAGVAAFYPLSSARLVIPANPRLRLTTGSRAEYLVCAGLLLSLLVSVHLHTSGGLRRTFNAWLAQPEGVTSLFAKASTTHQILAHIEGRLVASATPVHAEFTVLEVEGERLLVRAADGTLYWAEQESACTHCHLAIHRVQARLGQPIVITTQEWRWQAEELGKVVGGRWSVIGQNAAPSPALDHQPSATGPNQPTTDHQPPTTVFFSGELTLQDAPFLTVPQSLQHFNPVEVVGNADAATMTHTVKLHAASLDDLQPLLGYFGAGHVIVKIIHERSTTQ
jgi:inner membrane protein